MTQLDVVFINFCADALQHDREDFLQTVEDVFAVERSARAVMKLISLGVPCVDLDYTRHHHHIIYKSNNDIMKWIRETAMAYISHSEDVGRQFIEEISKLKEL